MTSLGCGLFPVCYTVLEYEWWFLVPDGGVTTADDLYSLCISRTYVSRMVYVWVYQREILLRRCSLQAERHFLLSFLHIELQVRETYFIGVIYLLHRCLSPNDLLQFLSWNVFLYL